ncbi:MAG: methionine synthase, partial [Candidatus Omnitrophica bacterium]|nr:methionine synthase [Candidatus Omnitrophota bacterium]
PSLEEMAHVAKEMEREGFKTPLLIGGATTSKNHCAIKIAPFYRGPVIHVKDASISATIARNLSKKITKERFIKGINKEYDKLRKLHAEIRKELKLITLNDARKNKLIIDFQQSPPFKPNFLGTKTFKDHDLKSLKDKIDWSYFFIAWEIEGKYPQIFEHPKKGKEAKKLFKDANEILDELIAEGWLRANGTIGIFPANSINEDIIIFKDEKRKLKINTLHFLRQQTAGLENNLCLSDFIAPKISGVKDYLGAFAVSAGFGSDKISKLLSGKKNDYKSIMIKILADRMAESFAEEMHERVRKSFWGYAPDEKLPLDDLLNLKYQGIRPAPGYPACPDHSEKEIIFKLLNATKNTGIKLTENMMMVPPASVCGLYFAHPQSKYFNLGKVSQEQIKDYSKRKALSFNKCTKWLGDIIY